MNISIAMVPAIELIPHVIRNFIDKKTELGLESAYLSSPVCLTPGMVIRSNSLGRSHAFFVIALT